MKKSLLLFLVIANLALFSQQELALYKLKQKSLEHAEVWGEFKISGFQTAVKLGDINNGYSQALLFRYTDPASGKDLSHLVGFAQSEQFKGFTVGMNFIRGNLLLNAFNYTRGYNWGIDLHRVESGVAYILRPTAHSALSLRPGADLVFSTLDCNIYNPRDSIVRDISIKNKNFARVTGETLVKNTLSIQPNMTITYDLFEHVQLQAYCGYTQALLDIERVKFEGHDPKMKKGATVMAYMKASNVLYYQDGTPIHKKAIDVNALNFRLGVAFTMRG